MTELYECIKKRNPSLSNVIFTVLEGEEKGQKVYFSGEEVVWHTKEWSYLEQQTERLLAVRDGGVIKDDGADGIRIFCEPVGNTEKLVICGGGHVSVPMIHIGKMLGFTVTVLEDRPSFADNARKAGADQVICESFKNGMNQIAGDKDTYFIIVTRGHRYDSECLKEAVLKPNAYTGMMGSRRRAAIVKENLESEGIKKELLDKVYTPIGLSIGAETPQEIAVAVMAEIIRVRNKNRRFTGYSEELLEHLTGYHYRKKKKMLATIVSRNGSAPREVGTKMLIEEDGEIVGTIGGGCAESAVIQKALNKIRGGEKSIELVTADMTGREAEEAGMVCGGTIEVLLELVE